MQQQQKQEKIAAKEAAKQLFDSLKCHPWLIGVLVVRARHTGLYGIYELRVFSRQKNDFIESTIKSLMAQNHHWPTIRVYAEPDAEEVWKKLSAKK
jgi:hypothetical protein